MREVSAKSIRAKLLHISKKENISFQLMLIRYFHAGCYIGMAGEIVTWEDETNTGLERTGEELSSVGINWGIKLGMNLFTHNVHLTGSFGGYHYGEVSYDSGLTYETGTEYEESIYLDQKWTDIFPGKKTFNFNFSVQ